MQLTGHSTDFVVGTGFADAVRAFLAAQTARWSGLYFCGEPATADCADLWQPDAHAESEHPDILTFSSGAAMEEFWEEHGYAPNREGEGPFSLFYLHRRSLVRARLDDELLTDHPDLTAAVRGTTLLLSDFHLVSLVTPGDPETDPFSASVLNDFLRCFALGTGSS
ncbi:hypothetical protein ABH931_005962 [Streptacidiphilus sp. MAP12-33]|uniref:hypothetical protein n=1 Tax=Streptacidiphilus sp. MAP12-33 TaxID=3156266 RepID=UPI003515F541